MYQVQLSFPFARNRGPSARPFLKWAGGKGQLLGQIGQHLPSDLRDGKLSKYAEPFIGGGAVFFLIANQFGVGEYFISDMNEDLVLAYRTIQQQVEELIERLDEMQRHYLQMAPERRKEFFYDVRRQFNLCHIRGDDSAPIQDAALQVARLIFLNRTCFNGLYRVNSRGEFNVPFGNYRKPPSVTRPICRCRFRMPDPLRRFQIARVSGRAALDPPYRPISRRLASTDVLRSRLTTMNRSWLGRFYHELGNAGAKLMLSSSDPQNENPHDRFFEDLYGGFSIHKVLANRRISNGAKRGPITERRICCSSRTGQS